MLRMGVLALALVGTQAVAATWEVVGRTTPGSIVQIDVGSIRRANDFVTLWVRYDHSQNKTETARESKVQMSISCVGRSIKTLSTYDYRANGTILKSYVAPSYDLSYEPAVPDSIGEEIVGRACAFGQ